MAGYTTLSDTELLQLLKESDHAAYTEVYHRYFYLLYVHAYKKLRDEEQSRDIIQDLFVNLWLKREFGLPATNLAGYLFISVRNKIFDLFAHRQLEANYMESFKYYLNSCSRVAADHRVRENQLRAYIENEIQALPPKMKRIFEMSRKENLSHKEIAERLSISENNVSKQVNNALRVLKTRLGIIIYICFLINQK